MEEDRRMISGEDIEAFLDEKRRSELTFNVYQKAARRTAIYTDRITYPTLGLCGEAGEVAEKIKKFMRDGVLNDKEVAKELGDVLWYIANLAEDLGYDLAEIADMNLEKLADRKSRGVIKGNGDNR
jgi:NTP pyrophosphatase (non-canonical NTP hydrolase)